jgi:hypothetical protein
MTAASVWSVMGIPEREIMTGIGPVAVRCPRVRDRVGEGSERSSPSARSIRADTWFRDVLAGVGFHLRRLGLGEPFRISAEAGRALVFSVSQGLCPSRGEG